MAAARFVADSLQRWMEHFVDVPLERTANLLALRLREIGQLAEQPLQFLLAHLLPIFAQSLHDGSCRSMVQVLHEPLRLFFNDRQRGGQLVVALAAIAPADGLEVIDRVQINAQPVADRRLEIPRHGKIEDQQRPLIRAAARSARTARASRSAPPRRSR